MMPEEAKTMSPERKNYIKDTIMSVLFELYEDQTGMKFNWTEVTKEEETA